MSQPLSPPLIFLVILFLQGCASYTDETREMRSFYQRDQYRQALEKLESSVVKSNSNNLLLYHMEKAMLLDRLGEVQESRKELFAADKLADDLFTVSVAKTATSFFVNDASTDYEGELYEKIQIHTMLALSYLQSNDLKSARVEARKINSKLNEINANYDTNKYRYGEDAFALYLAGMIYEALGEVDDAIIDYGKAVSLFEGSYSSFTSEGTPKELIKSLHYLLERRRRTEQVAALEKKYTYLMKEKDTYKNFSEQGEVIVIHQLGNIAYKVNTEFVLPIGRQVVRFSFPVVSNSRAYFATSGLSFEGKNEFYGAEMVQNLNSIAYTCLDDRRLRMIVKTGARLLAKGQVTEYAYKQFGPLGGIAANVYSAITETGDTRSWTLLPAAFYVTRARVTPGKHSIAIKSNGRVSERKDIVVNKGEKIFLRDVE